MDTLHNVNIAVSFSGTAVKASQSSIVIESLSGILFTIFCQKNYLRLGLGGSTSKTPTVIPLIFRSSPTSLPSERTAIIVAAYPLYSNVIIISCLICKDIPPRKENREHRDWRFRFPQQSFAKWWRRSRHPSINSQQIPTGKEYHLPLFLLIQTLVLRQQFPLPMMLRMQYQK